MQTEHLEVVPYKYWQHPDGRKASLFSAGIDDEWQLITKGFTIRDNKNSTQGMGRKPFDTKQEALDLIAHWSTI